jgi:hypothetical protein
MDTGHRQKKENQGENDDHHTNNEDNLHDLGRGKLLQYPVKQANHDDQN